MKKLLLTIAVFCFSFVILQAQFSARAGLNIAQGVFSLGTTDLSSGPLYGFNAGFEANFKIAGPLYINAGLLYTQKGTCYEVTIIQTVKGNLQIEYIEIPVNLKVKLDAGPVKLFAQGGVYGAYAIANKMTYNNSDNKDYHFDFGTDDDTMDRLDFGYGVGCGIGFSQIELAVNYSQGFSSVYNEIQYIPQEIINKVISVSATFAF